LGNDSLPSNREHYDAVVIGGGQAGLSVGYHLARAGVDFVILDANERIGDSWRQRWDSLRLFSPARFDGLAGMPYPVRGHVFPTKDEIAEYLQTYAHRFRLPVRNGTLVQRVTRRDGRYLVQANGREFKTAHVVIAMSGHQQPRVPAFASQLRPSIVQLHSSEYRNLSQLSPGPVLIVGAGNSGAELAREVVGSHSTWLSGPTMGQLPFRIETRAAAYLFAPLFIGFLFHYALTVRTPLGRFVRSKVLHRGAPLIRVKAGDLAALGVQRVSRTIGVADGLPQLQDGRSLSVANVIWCTGYTHDRSWIELPVFDEDRQPRHTHGVARDEPGLYFVGLDFLYAMSSAMIRGVSRDAARVARVIAARLNRMRTDYAVSLGRW
jgi:putative flavoprotein involved in K+ transport